MRLRVGVPREVRENERRVALEPTVVKALTTAGTSVIVEAAAGQAAHFPDRAYEEAGARVASGEEVYAAECVVKVAAPTRDELARLRAGQLLIGFLNPLGDPVSVQALAATGVSALAMELIPRITRAQGMDALSSQATVAGYRAVLLSASTLGRFFPLLITAAGTVKPARVLILGAGVAGLQAIATARRLGAVVGAFDVRPAVREQVESLGARFLEIELAAGQTETAGGYAVELSAEAHHREQELVARAVADADVVITTALVPGRPAPVLISADAVAAMRPGSVIIDLAAEAGGNCALTEPGVVRDVGDVTINGTLNLASGMSQHASQLYAKNVSALLGLVGPDGASSLDLDDEIIRESLVCRDGRVTHPRVAAQLAEKEGVG